MKKKIPAFLIITGIILLLVAGVIGGYNLIEDYLAGQRAQLVLEQMRQPDTPVSRLADFDLSDGDKNDPVSSVGLEGNYDTVGILSISRLGLELPVLSKCTDRLLKVSVCRYMGDAQDIPERLVVAGHNYKKHFGNLSKLSLGDEVCFTNQDGITYRYAVTQITEIAGNDQQGLERGKWDITLFTCNSDGSRRILVRCLLIP